MGVVLYYCDSGSTYRILIIHTRIADIPVQNFTCVIPKSQGQGSGCGRFEQQTFRTITHRSEIIYGRPYHSNVHSCLVIFSLHRFDLPLTYGFLSTLLQRQCNLTITVTHETCQKLTYHIIHISAWNGPIGNIRIITSWAFILLCA